MKFQSFHPEVGLSLLCPCSAPGQTTPSSASEEEAHSGWADSVHLSLVGLNNNCKHAQSVVFNFLPEQIFPLMKSVSIWDGWGGRGAYKDLVSEGLMYLPGKNMGRDLCLKCGERLYLFMAYPSFPPSLFFRPPPSIHLYLPVHLPVYPIYLICLYQLSITSLCIYLAIIFAGS